jgi:hypothetical protein
MGRSIPSFRQLIEVEHYTWSEFKKELKNKNDRKTLDSLFEYTKLYTPYLSFANRPIPIEPMFMGMIYHLYKTILDITNNSTNKEFGVDQEIVTLEIYKPQTKELFDKTYDRWLGLINSLHEDDREQFLKMLCDCCNGLSEGTAKLIKEKDSKSVSVIFFLCLALQIQKLLERVKNSVNNKKILKADDILLNFIK